MRTIPVFERPLWKLSGCLVIATLLNYRWTFGRVWSCSITSVYLLRVRIDSKITSRMFGGGTLLERPSCPQFHVLLGGRTTPKHRSSADTGKEQVLARRMCYAPGTPSRSLDSKVCRQHSSGRSMQLKDVRRWKCIIRAKQDGPLSVKGLEGMLALRCGRPRDVVVKRCCSVRRVARQSDAEEEAKIPLSKHSRKEGVTFV